MEKWFIKNKKFDFKKISEKFGISAILAKLLVNRDIFKKNDIEIFLDPTMEKLSNPDCMKDLRKGSDIIINKIKEENKIRIVGDYDVDGVMSVYILYKGLKSLGADVDFCIPDRVLDGYGINIDIIQKAIDDGVDTIITCDNGISAIEQIDYAKNRGMTVIITDHHDLPFKEDNGVKEYLTPNADAIINPKQVDCNFAEKNLCGAGIAYVFIMYLYKLCNKKQNKDEFIEFAAIATICDVVDLVGDNRIIVGNGLKALNNTPNIGLKALIDISSISDVELGVYHVGFIIGPTINASGRLDSAIQAIELLLTDNVQTAYEIAKSLRDLNDERKNMTQKGVEKVIDQIESSGIKDDKIIVVYESDIHESIAGIIAGRIKDRYNKPTIVLTKGNEGVKGSGRSIDEYNMNEELSKCKDLLTKFGGHPMAAGLSLEEENIEEFRLRLNNGSDLSIDDLIPKIYIDMELPLEYINYKIIEEINILKPYGKGNPKPIFGAKGLSVQRGFILGANKNVLKLSLISPLRGQRIEGIMFRNVDEFMSCAIETYGNQQIDKMLNGVENEISLDILYYPDINEYNGNVKLQVVINSFRFT